MRLLRFREVQVEKHFTLTFAMQIQRIRLHN